MFYVFESWLTNVLGKIRRIALGYLFDEFNYVFRLCFYKQNCVEIVELSVLFTFMQRIAIKTEQFTKLVIKQMSR